MNEEMYKKINESLNDFFVKASKEDPIFIDNLEDFCYLSDIIIDNFDDIYKKQRKKCNITFNDVYLIAREIIETIEPKYLNKYDQILHNGILDFSYENEYYDSHYKYVYDYNNKTSFNEININRSFDYADVTTLIHEFFHYSNGDCLPSHNRKFLTEFISIYFQEYAKKYLMQEKKLTSKDVLLNSRIIDSLIINNEFNSFCLLLLAYDKLGNLSSNTPDEMKEILYIGYSTFEKECLKLVKIIDTIGGSEYLYSYFTKQYPYIIGCVLAYYALKYCKVEDIIKLNDSLNDLKYVDLNVYELLELYGININSDLIYESIDIMKKILNNNLKK